VTRSYREWFSVEFECGQLAQSRAAGAIGHGAASRANTSGTEMRPGTADLAPVYVPERARLRLADLD
jgi:hypothetical protein